MSRRGLSPFDSYQWLQEHVGPGVAELAAGLDTLIATADGPGPRSEVSRVTAAGLPRSARPSWLKRSTPGIFELAVWMAEAELVWLLHQAAGLTTKQRALVRMQAGGLTVPEMARWMESSPGTVKQHLHRARAKMAAAESTHSHAQAA